MAFGKVLDILGEQSADAIIKHIQKKYGVLVFSNPVRSLSLQEIEDTIPEIFPIGGKLIIKILEAELDMVE